MIDTIVLEIHNLKQYPHLENVLLALATEHRGLINRPQHEEFINYTDTGKLLTRSKGHLYIPSSHYKSAYVIDRLRDLVIINISIPKFLYGHNVKMYVAHQMDRDFNYLQGTDLKFNLYDSFQRLHNFVNYLNKLYFTVNLVDIKLARLDLCFNQIFSSCNEKNMYLSQVKGKKVTYTTRTKKNQKFRTGIHVARTNTTCKIYDKGAEFKINDAKRLSESPNTRAFVSQLQPIADKILRYEIGFKRSFFKKIVNNERHNYYSYISTRNSNSSSYFGYLSKRFSEMTLINSYLGTVNANHIGTKQKFAVLQDFNFEPKSPFFFNKKLYSYAINYYRKFLRQWVISPTDLNTLSEKIDRNNSIKKVSGLSFDPIIRKNGLLRFVEDFQRHGNTLVEQGFYTKSTYYRYLKQLDKLGYQNVQIASPIGYVDNWNLIKYHQLFIS